MKEFDWTGIDEGIKEAMLGALTALYEELEIFKEMEDQDRTAMELLGLGESELKKRIVQNEELIEQSIKLLRDLQQ